MNGASRGAGAVEVRACAKINRTLRILGVRPDGYHELRTTFQSLAIHDTLIFERRRGPFRIDSDAPSSCPADESNLVWKAAAALWRVARRRGSLSGVHVRIRKRVPAEAGLGGGSSDAAATLRALAVLWDLRVPEAGLADVGRELGADVAFFLTGGTVLGLERGDLLFPLADPPRSWVVLARPDFGVSTREAYGWWDELFALSASPRGRLRAGAQTDEGNDLERAVAARHPSIARLVRRLRALGSSQASMSGSGSSVFGLFDARDTAEAAASAVAGPGVSTWVTRTTTRREHARLSAVRPVPPGHSGSGRLAGS
ncbi:MAG: 4-(cytidine 5'-diphospho)-2-C-methyl-D-erythritol kinase [Vicinamibacterales bacterium]